jgi:hypothetical protein
LRLRIDTLQKVLLTREKLFTKDAAAPLLSHCFDKQAKFVRDAAKYKTACCSRRAGKTEGCGADLLASNVKKPKAPSLYLTLTRAVAKRNIWGVLLKLNRDFGLGYEPNESELVLKKYGVGCVYLAGVDNASEIEKIRGTGWGHVVVDEAQSIPTSIIKPLIEDVLMPSFMDHEGSVALVGTPGAVPVGYFYECLNKAEWSPHYWTVFDNPHIKEPAKRLAEVLSVRGLTQDDPSIQREFFGRWVHDANSLVFRFSAEFNVFENKPAMSSYVIGVDLGFDDADAIAVLGWAHGDSTLYLVDEWVGTKQSITELGDRLKATVAKYRPRSVVADTGALGKKIADELTTRWALKIEPAEKVRKLEHIELLNDGLRSGKVKVARESRFAMDCMLVEWDRSNPEKPEISDKYHSDICDAVLYAYRKAHHWLEKPLPAVPNVDDQLFAREVKRMEREKAMALGLVMPEFP